MTLFKIANKDGRQPNVDRSRKHFQIREQGDNI